jgi:hypothetical protein
MIRSFEIRIRTDNLARVAERHKGSLKSGIVSAKPMPDHDPSEIPEARMSIPIFRATLVIAAALSLSMPAMAEHGRISAEVDLRALYSGATEKGNSRGMKFEIKYADDGTATVQTDSGRTDSGRWTIENGAQCLTWNKIRRGKKACFAIHHMGGNNYHLEALDGANDNDVEIVK